MAALQTLVFAKPAGRGASRFIIDKAIGHGTFGMVYRVREPRNCNQLYAMKTVKTDRIWVAADDHGGSSLQMPETDEEYAERVESLKLDLVDEAKTLSRLRHQNIIELKETVNVHYRGASSLIGPRSSYPAMLTELCDGTLWDLDAVHMNDPVIPKYRWTMFRHMISALVHIHELGLIHLDIKPKNIFYKISPHVRAQRSSRYGAHKYPPRTRYTFVLGDFGMCTTVAKAQGQNPGTRAYMAPEHEGSKPCCASDLYSLYVTLLVSNNVDGMAHRLADQSYAELKSMVRGAMEKAKVEGHPLRNWEYLGRSFPLYRGTARMAQERIWEHVDFGTRGMY